MTQEQSTDIFAVEENEKLFGQKYSLISVTWRLRFSLRVDIVRLINSHIIIMLVIAADFVSKIFLQSVKI